MLFQQLRAAARVPNKGAMFEFQRLFQSHSKLLFLRALLESGSAPHLLEPRTAAELGQLLETERCEELLQPLLELGVSLGELRREASHYRLCGRLSRALAQESGAPLAAMIDEVTSYHVDVFRDFPAQLAGAEPRNYLDDYSDVIAEGSRTLQPFLETFLTPLVSGPKPLRILEIGCGSGVFLALYAELNPQHRGIAIDYNPSVAEQARANLEVWGAAKRFEVLCEDIRSPSAALDGPFDLITSLQNLYYFSRDERKALFTDVRTRLAPGGQFAIGSAFHSPQTMAHHYAIVLNSTVGCHAFPDLREVSSDLLAAGFGVVQKRNILPGQPFWGLVARAS